MKKNIRIVTSLAGILVVFNIITGCFATDKASSSNDSIMSLEGQASILLAKVGGLTKVYEDANLLFYRYQGQDFVLFQASDLTNCPTLKALGNVDGLWPGPPQYIKIHVGYRPDGYYIEIVNTNSQVVRVTHVGEIELVKSCIFVHR